MEQAPELKFWDWDCPNKAGYESLQSLVFFTFET